MIVTLVRVDWRGFRPFAKGVPGALAWMVPGFVTVRYFMDYLFWGLGRLAHELEHHTTINHHPWWHFCIRVGHPFRLFWTHTVVSKDEARDLRGEGRVDLA